jgi:small-conductance mechanosensitive channel
MAIFFNKKAVGKRALVRNLLLLVPGIAGHFVILSDIVKGDALKDILGRVDIMYLTIVGVMICNSLLMIFLDYYSHTDKSRNRPLKALVQAIQVVMVFIGGIVCVAVLIGKSPKALLTGLGASAAVLMLVFKDSILGFVAGVQLLMNNMVKIGDWIQMPDGSANGTVEEMTLNTVKVRNWDNTISTIPPYTLISTPFKNWRGMQESGGRRVDKMIYLDMETIEVCSSDMIDDIRKNVPLMKDYKTSEMPVNSQLYRVYIERYLRTHPVVAQNLDLIIAQRQPDQFGLPIEVYFFLTEKVWDRYEKIQSDIFDHLIAMASDFGLKLYQLTVH